ncbi:3-octaprenyl-4-hydroxybenzoate carboxy-lyase UbiX [Thermotomaculum hydrothermale]|uniref:Flavin prenyltransferase UbiX n=1 Tax=Thermotomaculum hydrothermale TaxID=981385 RepID=A0A7R6PT63_9BACT|nr:UbiX family flavin prenyltransferase [Thermotomaculum hydrothermale]BBB32172.1 3-octaprenyl-4-hydroxybenzoate carboxy-lyase UbiX [Thermotomaculum hydrothermale]
MKKRIAVAVTGASGLKLGDYFLRKLAIHSEYFEKIFVIFSENAKYVAQSEGFSLDFDFYKKHFDLLNDRDFASPIASGSYPLDGMVIIPCSVSSLASIATGVGINLIHRAADVCLKERRKLILVPRETPLSPIHLENMHKLSLAGAIIAPFIPSFYNKPESIEDMLDFFSLRILDLLGISLKDERRWKIDE